MSKKANDESKGNRSSLSVDADFSALVTEFCQDTGRVKKSLVRLAIERYRPFAEWLAKRGVSRKKSQKRKRSKP